MRKTFSTDFEITSRHKRHFIIACKETPKFLDLPTAHCIGRLELKLNLVETNLLCEQIKVETAFETADLRDWH